ncbi:MAG: FkbM family methyltransferase [Burkholderiales bacterium]
MQTRKTTIRMAGDLLVSVPDDRRLMTPYVLCEQEDWFEDEIKFLRKLVRPGMRILDIGANYGLYTLSLARGVGGGGRVLAVEPCAETAACLRESLALNQFHFVTVVQAALSNRTGKAQLQVGANSELNSLAADAQGGGSTEEVNLATLDGLAAEHVIDEVDFVKMDAEGEEERIIRGGMRFFQTQNPLVMYEIKSGDKVNIELIRAFAELGFTSFRLIPGLDMLVPYDTRGKPEPYQLNLFCCKKDRAANLALHGALVEAVGPQNAANGSQNWWRDDLACRSFARGMQEGWRVTQRFPLPDSETYDSILAFYGASRDISRRASDRWAALRAAFEKSRHLADGETDPYRLSTCARIARECGERHVAVTLLRKAIQCVMPKDPGPAREAFLPAGAHFDEIDPEGRFWAWLLASLLDQAIALSSFSTYFAQPDLLQSLELLKSTGFHSPEMERRRQLLRMRARLQPGAEPDACLIKYHEGNRNPEFWQDRTPFQASA